MDYTTLVGAKTLAGSIKYLINYSEIDAAGIMAAAESAIYARLRVRDMRKVTTLDITLGATSVDLPADWLSPISLKLRYRADLILRPPGKMSDYRNYDETTSALLEGLPTNVFLSASKLELDVKADAAYTIDAVYYAKPDALSDSNTTNFLTTDLGHILRNKVLELAHQERKEFDTARTYRQLYEVDMSEYEKMADLENDTMIYDYEQV